MLVKLILWRRVINSFFIQFQFIQRDQENLPEALKRKWAHFLNMPEARLHRAVRGEEVAHQVLAGFGQNGLPHFLLQFNPTEHIYTSGELWG